MLDKGEEGAFVLTRVLYQFSLQAKPKGAVSLCRAGIPCVEERAALWVQQECCGCAQQEHSSHCPSMGERWPQSGCLCWLPFNLLALGSGEPLWKDHAHDRNYFDCNFWGQRIQICLSRFPSVMSLSSSVA